MAKNFFSVLPVEIISMILETLSPSDVFHAALASRYCHQVYSAARTRTLVRSLRNNVPEQLWSEFCAAQFILTNFGPLLDRAGRTYDVIRVQAFLDRYFSMSKFELSTTENDLNVACKLHHTVSYFIHDYTWQALSEASRIVQPPLQTLASTERDVLEDQDGTKTPAVTISTTERHRLLRAFLRFQIYTGLFRPPQTFAEETDYDGDVQFRHFLQRFKAWQVEEITCVHQYLADIVTNAVNQMSHEFEVRTRFLITKAVGDTNQKYGNLSKQYHTWFYYCSEKFRRRGTRITSSLVSSGLFSMFKLARSNKAARFLFLREKCECALVASPFLFDALLHCNMLADPFPGSLHLASKQEVYNHDGEPGEANAGYVYLKPGGGYLGVEGAALISYRRLGYIFWDSIRIELPALQSAFSVIATLDYHSHTTIGPAEGSSPEEHLGPVWLPGSHLEELIHLFRPVDVLR
ncbi:hypothetical protein PWT90_04144 [Aphanocladium album]|nr:hypothetical protein PWT90_04144 [Aphanocladium album]